MADNTEAAAAVVVEAQRLLDRGHYLAAFDLAQERLQEGDDPELQYLAVLALARSGATDRALELFARFGLGDLATGDQASEDVGSLEGRLAKDRALATSGPGRQALLAEAAQRYQRVFERTGGSYPCINAATMWLLAGEMDRALQLAAETLRLTPESSWSGDYWSAATAAEAALILGATETAGAALSVSDALSEGRSAVRAVTRRQLGLVCDALGRSRDVLSPLATPPVMHFTGHRISRDDTGRFPAREEQRVAREIRDHLEESGVGFGFGSLASGADILVVEALIARGAEAHVVLPFAAEGFVTASVADSGEGWVNRFRTCMESAASVTYASHSDYLQDPLLFRLCADVAMGDALALAQVLGSEVHQLAIWDGAPASPGADAGTAADIDRWSSLMRPTVFVSSGPAAPPATAAGAEVSVPREVRALLFADVAGFSRLSDSQTPRFMTDVMGTLGEALEPHADQLLLRRTWGDGIYLVLDDVPAAASVALALQRAWMGLDLEGMGMGDLTGLRIAGHAGPVFRGWDRISDELAFYGATVVRAARIEPRTPEGEVYVTHPFAALSMLTTDRDWSCHYVGKVPTAKDYGSLPMYHLRAHR